MCTRTHSYRKSVAVVWLWYILCASLISSTAGFCCMMNRQRQRWTPISTSISTSCVMPLKSEANGLNSIDSEQHQEDELSPAQLSPSASPSPSPSLLSTLLSRFQGDFDNYNQVYSDRSNGLLPREGGGHEHFHVTLLPLPATIIPEHLFPLSGLVSETETETKTKMERGAVVAAYYFDGMPNRIFRLRMYTLSSFKVDADADVSAAAAADVEREEVHMKLYTFDPKLEGKLRQESEDVVDKWVDIISDHLVVQDGDGDGDGDDDVDQQELFQELERCDIVWTSEPDPVRHAYLEDYAFPEDNDKQTTTNGIDHPDPVHAIMVNDHEKGGVLLESQMMPGSFLRIQDELSLWENQLWINDRGHDAESKAMVYGNWEGVPYQMDRVATISTSDSETESESLQRKIVDSSLRWTLGDRWRSEEEYESKMAAVGGLTTRMNQNKAKR